MDDCVIFEGLEIPKKELNAGSHREIEYPAPLNWTPISIKIPDTAPTNHVAAIRNFIKSNTKKRFRIIYNYSRLTFIYDASKASNNIVVYFEDQQDAFMFKLLGGERAYELAEFKDAY